MPLALTVTSTAVLYTIALASLQDWVQCQYQLKGEWGLFQIGGDVISEWLE